MGLPRGQVVVLLPGAARVTAADPCMVGKFASLRQTREVQGLASGQSQQRAETPDVLNIRLCIRAMAEMSSACGPAALSDDRAGATPWPWRLRQR